MSKIEISASKNALRVTAEGAIAIVLGISVAAVMLGFAVKFLTNWL